jgi:hypothetical protein
LNHVYDEIERMRLGKYVVPVDNRPMLPMRGWRKLHKEEFRIFKFVFTILELLNQGECMILYNVVEM